MLEQDIPKDGVEKLPEQNEIMPIQ